VNTLWIVPVPKPSKGAGRLSLLAAFGAGQAPMLLLAGAILLLAWSGLPSIAVANTTDEQVCDSKADYFLGIENFDETIRLHHKVLKKHPDSALAHYHLGFAYGMMNDRVAEIKEYRRAAALGLGLWDLFLNMGLAYLQNHDLVEATKSLRVAVLLGPDHPESHFNLGLVYERRGMLAEAEQETLASLLLDHNQPDARNMLAVIYAEQGENARALAEWRDLVHDSPDGTGHVNLNILSATLATPRNH
jgi:tetratricopeptide (TPR) repeat protein